MKLLDVAAVRVRFGGVQALAGVSVAVGLGEIAGLIGPNGAGKTTLFNCVSGVLRPDGGRVFFDGIDLGPLPAHRRARLGIARTFQNLGIFETLTVAENLMVAMDATSRRGLLADTLRLPSARFEERRAIEHARALLYFLDLLDYSGEMAADLPVGLQRRVELGRALMTRPRLLLLDEPAAGLDPDETADLAELLLRIRQRFAVTALLVDHDMALVSRVCDTVHVLDFGEVLAVGPPADVLDDPAVASAYLGEAVA